MSDTEALDWYESHPDSVRWVPAPHGRMAWGWNLGNNHYAPGYSLRSVLEAARAATQAGPKGLQKSRPNAPDST